MTSEQDQVIALADFAVRNDLDIGSADYEYHRVFADGPELQARMLESIGPEMFSLSGHWAFLSLTGKPGPFVFPPPPSGTSDLTRLRRLRLRLSRMIAPDL